MEVKKEDKEVVEFKIDSNTALYIVYLLYKTNIISNRRLKDMLAEVKKPMPSDVAKYLVKEAAKVI